MLLSLQTQWNLAFGTFIQASNRKKSPPLTLVSFVQSMGNIQQLWPQMTTIKRV